MRRHILGLTVALSAAAAAALASGTDGYEVWAIDQSNSPGTTFGGTLYIWDGHDLENNNLEYGLVSSIDAALVGMSAYLAADSLGIKGLMIGAVRNRPLDVGKLLGMPRRVYPVFGMCLGWPAEAPKQKPRMDHGTVVHYERYRTEGLDAALDAYDAALAQHYDSIGKKTTRDSWTHDIDEKFAAPRRDKLRQYLKEMGFDFR